MKTLKSSLILLFGLALSLSACTITDIPTSSGEDTPASSSAEEGSSEEKEEKYYTIKWVNYDDKVLETDEKVLEGTVPTYDGADPTHPSEEHYTYVWTGWDSKVLAARKNETYKAVFTKKGEEFDITWNNYDGSKLLDGKGEYGKLPEYNGPVPVKPDTELKSYVFKGWSPDLVEATAAATYTAIFDEIDKADTIHFTRRQNINSIWQIEGEDLGIDFDFDYSDAYFFGNSFQRNDYLAMVSLGLSGFNYSKEAVNGFFSAMGFTDTYNSPTYDTEGPNQVAYTFAKKTIEDTTVVAVNIRGFEYGKEMIGNFFMGNSGEHTNFAMAMSYTYLGLLEYIVSHIHSVGKVKLWISGYSRSAAVANLLGKQLYHKAVSGELGGISPNDIYVYCFETPRGGDASNNNAYPFIHNYCNSYDLVTYVAPSEYGLKVYGEVIDIYNENMSDLLKNLDSRLVLKPFQPYKVSLDLGAESPLVIGEDEKSPKDIKEYLALFIDAVLSEDVTAKYTDLSTRSNFFRYVESHIEFISDLTFGLTGEQTSKLLEKVQDLSVAFNLLTNLMAETADPLIDQVKTLFDECGIDYVETELRSALTDLKKVVAFYIVQFMTDMNSISLINGVVTMVKNINPAIFMHLFETSYVCLKSMLA